MAINKIPNLLPWQSISKHLRVIRELQKMASTRPFNSKVLENQLNNNNQRLYPDYDEKLWLRSCEAEIREPVQGKIVGTVPSWLNGSLLRNGPGKLKFGTDEFQHLFDASALLHKFKIENGDVTYQCRFLESEAYKSNLKNNRIVSNEFGTTNAPDPCLSIFQRFSAMFQSQEPSDNASISLYPFGDELYAFSESRVLYKINPEDLSTEEPVHLNHHIAILHNTSHPHVDKDGSVFNLGLTLQSRKPHHIIICHPIAQCGKDMFKQSKVVASIPAQWPFHPCYMHSFGITENYFIIVEQPLTLSVPKIMLSKIKGNSIASTLEWFPGERARFNVIARKTGKLHRTFVADTFFYFHIIHQFEQDDHLIMDICTYDDAAVLDSVYIESLRTMQSNPNSANSFRARPDRFVLPLNPDLNNDNKVNLVKLDNTRAKAYPLPNGEIITKPERICDIGCELPRINNNYLGKPYRYFYAIDSDVDGKCPGSIIKVDTITKEKKCFWEEKCHLNEPVFVPSPSAKAEDDGVIITSMIWEHEERRVGLIILNAQNFTEIGRVVFDTPTTIPKTFHGWFTPHKS